MVFRPTFATRLNSFRARPHLYWKDAGHKPTTLELLARVATVPGLTQVDLNYPDHFEPHTLDDIRSTLAAHRLTLNGIAMRYYSDPAFDQGAFTNPDPAVREKAIQLTCAGIDALTALGGDLMTLWLGQDGYDYAFQVDHRDLWELELDGIRRVAQHNPHVRISIEYKPHDPRAYSVLADVGTTLLAIRELNLPNLGVTLDFAHVVYAGELPAAAATLIARYSHLYGVHLNDGYGRRDDGLMVGSVHLLQTLELLYTLRALGYDEAIYFDTFPDLSGLDPVKECARNIATVNGMLALLDRLDTDALNAILKQQDILRAQHLLHGLLLPSG